MTDHPSVERPAAAHRRWGACLILGLGLLAPGMARAAGPVQVRTPWFRYLLASIPAGGYLTLENAGAAPAVLTSAESPACGAMMLHRSETVGGTDRMVGVKQITIPGHGQFRFTPGGYHLMCMQPKMHPGETVPVTLRFADGSRLTVRFAVRGAKGVPAPGGTMPSGTMPSGTMPSGTMPSGTMPKMHM